MSVEFNASERQSNRPASRISAGGTMSENCRAYAWRDGDVKHEKASAMLFKSPSSGTQRARLGRAVKHVPVAEGGKR
jgi:hypothetical protein